MSVLICVHASLPVSQSASSDGEFRESDDCSLLLFRWLALTPQAPSGQVNTNEDVYEAL